MNSEQKIEQDKAQESFFNKVIDRTTDFLFSSDSRKWVLLLVVIGFILRILIINRIPLNADEMHYAPQAIGFIDSGKLQIMDEDSLWFFLTNLAMNLFGVTFLGARFMAILFGSLSIILIYILGRELFNERIALIASIIMAFSPAQFIEGRAEPDIMMYFFSFLSLYFLIRFLKTGKNSLFWLTWLSIGLACMVKQVAVVFVPVFFLYFMIHMKKHKNTYEIKKILKAAGIIILTVLPVLAFNYLLYQDKGILDLQFSRFTRIGLEAYQDLLPTMPSFSAISLVTPQLGNPPGILMGGYFFYYLETIASILLAIVGIFFLFKSRYKFRWLLALSFIFPFIFLSGTSLLSTHYVFGTFFISLLAALGISKISEKFKTQKAIQLAVYILVIIILAMSVIKINSHSQGFFGANELQQLIDAKSEIIDQNSLVVVDSRIYRGRIVFSLWDRHYLEASYFPNLVKNLDQLPGDVVSMNIYFIEAVSDDSGWGTIKDQSEFNKSMEDLVSFFSAGLQKIKMINDIHGAPHFAIYKGLFQLKASVLDYADSTHSWFYYPVGYKPVSQNFDYYEIYNTFGILLDKSAHIVLYLEVLLVMLLAIYSIYLLYQKK